MRVFSQAHAYRLVLISYSHYPLSDISLRNQITDSVPVQSVVWLHWCQPGTPCSVPGSSASWRVCWSLSRKW